MIDAADDRVVLPQLIVVNRLPPRPDFGQVRDDDVEVRLRVELAARVVLEHGIGEIAGTDGIALGVVGISAAFGEVLFDPGHGLAQ